MQATEMVLELHDAQIYNADSSSIILQNVTCSISKGEFVYLIGKTGSGKSSLLKTLYAAYPLKAGRGQVVGMDLTTLNRKSIPKLRRLIGIVFQDFNLLSDRNVYQNLRFVLEATDWPMDEKADARIAEVLQAVGLRDIGSRLPHQLSGGEQQRVVIARALLNNPRLLIADEPTGNLDPETSDDILALLRDISARLDMAVLLATHDYRILENFPARIMRCSNGHLYDEQTHIL
jgi:cell division transport system ATP-binding protein